MATIAIGPVGLASSTLWRASHAARRALARGDADAAADALLTIQQIEACARNDKLRKSAHRTAQDIARGIADARRPPSLRR